MDILTQHGGLMHVQTYHDNTSVTSQVISTYRLPHSKHFMSVIKH
jgi:hypothetical protein